uniref:M-phase phosphoprotein 6 n=1 Tax=Neogobius melanostomus TaxID=47308 RepID=A0A8C6S762_9GOBI
IKFRNKVKISKKLEINIKFMQRGLDAETKKQLEEDERRIISDEHWYLDLPELKTKENLIVEEKSIVPCEELRYGRVSFMGFTQSDTCQAFVIILMIMAYSPFQNLIL